jgi:predicted transposase/invertase (TIGR01784 family)
LISFDWAMKRLLRDKANHAVLEGLMTSLLNEKFTIVRFLESESNQEDENDKFNCVDILAENEKGELTIFEIQNNRELAYFHRILYGVSKVITDYINIGEDYEKVRKVYSINIVYFTLGQAKDYVYHGKTVFQGLHDPHDILKLSNRQSEVFFGDTFKNGEKSQREASDIFPEY